MLLYLERYKLQIILFMRFKCEVMYFSDEYNLFELHINNMFSYSRFILGNLSFQYSA
jgi:hypothetical protein